MSNRLGYMGDFLGVVKMEDYVLIVASGPSARAVVPPELAASHGSKLVGPGNPRWHDITEGHTIILCNGAPDIPGADIFMAFDQMAFRRGKWGNGKNWYGHEGRAKHYLIGEELARLRDPGQDYYTFGTDLSLQNMYIEKRVLAENPNRHVNPSDVPKRGILHGGATIVACAYQLAMHYSNVRTINLIGCEFHGSMKWDMDEHGAIRHGAEVFDLIIMKALGGMLYADREQKVDTYHIGESYLSCSQVSPHDFYDEAASEAG